MRCMKIANADRQPGKRGTRLKSAGRKIRVPGQGASCSRTPESEIRSMSGRSYSLADGSAAVRADSSNRGNVRFMPLPQVRKNCDAGYKPNNHIASSGTGIPCDGMLGHFRVASRIGAGGMGEVYRAVDLKLGRPVALKVLAARQDTDLDRRLLEEEARAASALNHPNIVTVYEVGESGSVPYLATELIEGETLREALLFGPMPMSMLLDVAVQIADALAAAHDAGIIHRDLKPANIMISTSGIAKLLDFGLATREVVPSDSGRSSTATVEASRGLEVAGTAGYMSPEQARARGIDFRSDQFSLGAILYEMASGKRAFAGENRIDTVYAVLCEEPPSLELTPGVPPGLRWIIERCLAKRPEQRFRSTTELAKELRSLRECLKDPGRPPRPFDRTAAMGEVLKTLIAVAASFLSFRPRSGREPQPIVRRP